MPFSAAAKFVYPRLGSSPCRAPEFSVATKIGRVIFSRILQNQLRPWSLKVWQFSEGLKSRTSAAHAPHSWPASAPSALPARVDSAWRDPALPPHVVGRLELDRGAGTGSSTLSHLCLRLPVGVVLLSSHTARNIQLLAISSHPRHRGHSGELGLGTNRPRTCNRTFQSRKVSRTRSAPCPGSSP